MRNGEEEIFAPSGKLKNRGRTAFTRSGNSGTLGVCASSSLGVCEFSTCSFCAREILYEYAEGLQG